MIISESEDEELLYNVALKPYVKEYTSQQNRSSQILDVTTITASSLDDFKTKLWTHFSRYVHRAATIEEDNFGIEEDEPTTLDLDRFIVFKRNNRFTNPGQITVAILHSMSSATQPTLTNVFKYSDKLVSKEHWTKFNQRVLQPAFQDRSGAAEDATFREIVDRLLARHSQQHTSRA
jgi:hypothetical protein